MKSHIFASAYRSFLNLGLLASCLFWPTASTANPLTAMMVASLPEQSEGAYKSGIAPAIAEAKARPGANPSVRLKESGELLLAPIIIYSGGGSREIQSMSPPSHFLPRWNTGGKSPQMQEMVNRVANKVRDGLEKKRGVTPVVSGDVRDMGIATSELGEAAAEATGATFVAFKNNKWGMDDFSLVRAKDAKIGSALFTHIRTVWVYKGHSKMNGEAVANYAIYTDLIVKLCDSTAQCTSASIAAGKPVAVIIPLTAKAIVDDKNHEINHELSYELASDYFSGVVLALFDNITGR